MELNKVKTVSKKQAKAYAVIALWEEIEVVMKLYSPREATKKAESILNKGGNAI